MFVIKKVMLLLAFVSSAFVTILAQNALLPEVMPSANATALGRYGQYQVSHYTGEPNISVPLYDMSSSGVNMNIGLTYTSSGVKVDEHPGWVGQNWHLNAGGVIVRSTKGAPDEEGMTMGSGYNEYREAYFDVIQDIPTWLTESNSDTYSELRDIADDKEVTSPTYKIRDSEPDIFSFNFCGKQGKFFLSSDGDWKVISDDNLKVVFDYTDDANFQAPFIPDVYPASLMGHYQHVIIGFKIIDEQGFEYHFGYKPESIEYSIPFYRQYAGSEFNYTEWVANAWHLTNVYDYRGNQIYNLNYQRSYFTAQLSTNKISQTIDCRDTDGNWTQQTANSPAANLVGSLNSPSYLQSISNNKNESLTFIISDATQLPFQYTFESNISYQNATAQAPQAPILPFLQTADYYSYDPVAALDDPFAGLKWKKLDRIDIRYQTNIKKGIEFNYNNDIDERLNLLSVNHLASDFPTNPNAEKYGYTFTYNSFGDLPEYHANQCDHFGYYNGIDEYIPADYYDYADLDINYPPSRASDDTYLQKGMLTTINYPTGGSAEFTYEMHDYNNVVSNDRQSILSGTGSIGGLRVKKIDYYDGIDNSSPTTGKEYIYKLGYQFGGTASSGLLTFNPTYVWFDWLTPTFLHPNGGHRETSFAKNALRPMTNHFETHIAYREVVEKENDGSYKIHHFTSHEDIKDELPYQDLEIDFSPYAKYSDRSHLRGKLFKTESYDSDNNLSLIIDNNYNSEIFTGSNLTEYGITIDAAKTGNCFSIVDPSYRGGANKIFHNKARLESQSVTNYYNGQSIATTSTNTYATPTIDGQNYRFLSSTEMTNSDGKVYRSEIEYPFNHTSTVGQQSILTTLTGDHRIGIPIYNSQLVDGVQVDGSRQLYALYGGTPEMYKNQRYEATWDQSNALSGAWVDHTEVLEYDYNFLTPTKVINEGWDVEEINLRGDGQVDDWKFNTHEIDLTYNTIGKLKNYIRIDGTFVEHEYDLFSRLKKQKELPKNVTTNYIYNIDDTDGTSSYFEQTQIFLFAANSAINQVKHKTFVDGLGRPTLKLDISGNPDGFQNTATYTKYDNRGRATKEYEPLNVGSSNNFTPIFNATNNIPHTEILYDAIPEERTKTATQPNWYDTDYDYETNSTSLVSPYGTTFPLGSLTKVKITDPEGNANIKYTDKRGRTVLSQQSNSSESETLSTWTEYDDKNRVKTIYPPNSTNSTSDLLYSFRYDGNDNLLYRNLADQTAEEYRYNDRNLKVASRNGILNASGQWMVCAYDDYGRITQKGYHNQTGDVTVDNPSIDVLLEEYFFDGFDGTSTLNDPIYTGKLRKERHKVLEDLGSNPNWIEKNYSYDLYGRVSTIIESNHLIQMINRTLNYDFADNLTFEDVTITGINPISFTKEYNYDHRGRSIKDEIIIDASAIQTIAEYDHDPRSLVTQIRLHPTTSFGDLQTLDYTYNAQRWLTSINAPLNEQTFDEPCPGGSSSSVNSLLPGDDLFYFQINYDDATIVNPYGADNLPFGVKKNGNISSIFWQTQEKQIKGYSYDYDFANRLKSAEYGQFNQVAWENTDFYSTAYSYDDRGNVMTLDRNQRSLEVDDITNCYKSEVIDDLTYTYFPNSNRLKSVTDNAPCPDLIILPEIIDADAMYSAKKVVANNTTIDCRAKVDIFTDDGLIINDSLIIENCFDIGLTRVYDVCIASGHPDGFNQVSVAGEYEYDISGNLIKDPHKGIDILYNHLNLPYKITSYTGKPRELKIYYDALGNKLSQAYYEEGGIINKRDYTKEIEYQDDLFDNLKHTQGRITKSETGDYEFEYHLKDHLGNTRVRIDADGEIISQDHYYPFGLRMNGEWQETAPLQNSDRYTYNGKEGIDELGINLLDYGARYYDAAICRFTTIDRFAEKYTPLSGYQYGANNPINTIDINGDSTYLVIWTSGGGEIGHAGIAFDNYDKDGNADGTVTFYSHYPKGEVNDDNVESDVENLFEKEITSKFDLFEVGGTTLQQYGPDAVVSFETSKPNEADARSKLENFGSDYNGVSCNCVDFAQEGLEAAMQKSVGNAAESILGRNVSAPNKLYHSAKNLTGSRIIKNPGNMANSTLIESRNLTKTQRKAIDKNKG